MNRMNVRKFGEKHFRSLICMPCTFTKEKTSFCFLIRKRKLETKLYALTIFLYRPLWFFWKSKT